MEQPQVSAQFEYLERKYQEAQNTIARLQQRIEAQAYELQEQTLRMQNLEEELSQATAQAARISQLDEQLAHFKDEILQVLERRIGRYQPASPETGSNLAKQQLDSQMKALNELQREVEKTRRFDDQIALLRAETTRLNKDVSKFQTSLESLGKQVDERMKPVLHLEERRRADTRLLTELQAELPELNKKVETNLSKIQLVEQKVPQFAKYEAALESIREEIRRHREHMDYQVAQRERQLKNWTEIAETTERRLKENEGAMEKYAEHYQLNKRALASLQDFQERLQNDQHRIRELQRLAEERQRAELEKFQVDFEQRWQRRNMELQPQFSDFQRSVEACQKRIDEIARLHQGTEEQLNLVLQVIEEDIQARALATANWQKRFEEIANGRG
jgi:chromosome segregation ATPase